MNPRSKDWATKLDEARRVLARDRLVLGDLFDLAPDEAAVFVSYAENTLHAADALLDKADAEFQRLEK